jgi:hypothetical protein
MREITLLAASLLCMGSSCTSMSPDREKEASLPVISVLAYSFEIQQTRTPETAQDLSEILKPRERTSLTDLFEKQWPGCEFRVARTKGSDLFGICLKGQNLVVVSGYTEEEKASDFIRIGKNVYMFKYSYEKDSLRASEQQEIVTKVRQALIHRWTKFEEVGLVSVEFH